ncbi:BvgS-like domain-containing signal transduction sensor histidine kinase (NMT1 domain) [Arcobacter venerupis]|uniref:histidine kinase n=1 Tax=Arcobacter venerupis TaxID=1054033 RepID=A0AAE7E3L9_9BACT|nr:ABC transporter substrate-binding protein [Arcobacter venerupis]QKF65786.1 BvgS-like domain-containing signal transduction sensor histidine kinase (NMT1 domain) [Arcobacter venerupis]RWS50295.1 hypothetical protein CKA56_05000 [Arcobacter venerupis]
MKRIIFIFILNTFLLSFLNASNLQKTSVQLMWFDQFEFAGFYTALEKGFYKDYGLDVELKKYTDSTDVTKEVLEKKADFGINSSSLLLDISQNKDIILLGSIFQSSPVILLTLKKFGINHLQDIKNKTIMMTEEEKKFATLQSMLISKGLSLNDINIINNSFDINDLINRKTDLILAFSTNEPLLLQERGYEYNMFQPKDYGFDFYEDIIFTTNEFATENPKLVHNFYEATIKGFEYAFNNIDEIVKLIYDKYNSQNKSLESLTFEANEMKKLIFDKNGKIGTITQEKMNLIINTYKVMGLLKKDIHSKDFIYNKDINSEFLLNKSEKDYLLKKKVITMCVDPNWMPFEKIEKNKHIGIAADYIELIKQKINTPITLIPTKTWTESLELGQKKVCDIFSLVRTTPQREKYLNFSVPYISAPLVIATNMNAAFIDNISQIKDKKLAIVSNYAVGDILKVKYPNIDFIDVENVQEGLNLVQRGKVFGFIGTLPTVGYNIQNYYTGQLKISGKLDEVWNLGIGSRNDEPILNDIFNKAITDISITEKQEILNKWISVNYQKEFNYYYLYTILTILAIIIFIGILFYRHYLLKKLNIKLNKRIKEEIKKNEEKNRILIQQSRMASMGEMLENIAHQWRQPLSTISVAASGMEIKKEFSTLSDEEFYEAINHIKKSTLYLSNTIDDFRSFFSKEKNLKNTDINIAIEKALELMGSTFIKNRIQLIKNIQNITILSLENELIQVLMNIFVNAKDALRHTIGNDKYIIIDIYRKEENLIIQIKDSGGGIKDDIIDKIFEPYFTTKHKFRGTGIGLYMSKLLVEKHLKGTLSAKNVEFTFMDSIHKGALFEIVLPIS